MAIGSTDASLLRGPILSDLPCPSVAPTCWFLLHFTFPKSNGHAALSRAPRCRLYTVATAHPRRAIAHTALCRQHAPTPLHVAAQIRRATPSSTPPSSTPVPPLTLPPPLLRAQAPPRHTRTTAPLHTAVAAAAVCAPVPLLSTSWLSACQVFDELPQGNFFSFFFSSAMMAGDEKGKGKAVVKSKRKWTHEECEWDHALEVPNTQGQPQRPVRIRETPEEA